MALDTDLALESYVSERAGKLEGVRTRERFDEAAEFTITEITVESEAAAKRLQKPCGTYITLETEAPLYEYHPNFSARCEAIARELSKVCKGGSTLFVGLGNRRITADSLGPLAADSVFATRHIKRLARELDTSELTETTVISPGVMAQTGAESSEIAAAVCREVRPQQVIVCDALACSQPAHMGHTIQISSAGIAPGSGVDNSRAELSEKYLGVPTVAIGVPTVSRLLFSHEGMSDLLITPKPIDKLAAQAGTLISAAVNIYLHPSLSAEEIASLIM